MKVFIVSARMELDTHPLPPLSTTREIAAFLASANLPKFDETQLLAISTGCRDAFLGALMACAHHDDSDEARRGRRLIENVAACLSTRVVKSVTSIGLQLSLSDLSCIGALKPVRFLSAVAICENQTDTRYGDAKAFLIGFVANREWASSRRRYHAPSLPESPKAPTQRMENTDSTAPKRFRSEHVYGASAALCFNAIAGIDGVPGIMIDAAESKGSEYDWNGATHFWLNISEVMGMYATLRKARKHVEFSGHGARHDKSLDLIFQGPHFFCRIRAPLNDRQHVRAVKIMPDGVARLVVLLLEQIKLAYPTLSARDLSELACATWAEEVSLPKKIPIPV